MYAVLGATGNTGRAVVDGLLARGVAVRAVLRDAAKGDSLRRKGCEVAVASAADAGALASALAGVDGAHLMVPPPVGDVDFHETAARSAGALAAGAASARVPHVVALSSVGAHMTKGNGAIGSLTVFEQALREAGLDRTILRPAYFMANWSEVAGMARDQGVLPTMLQPPGRPVPMVSTDDIGEAAAALLLDRVERERVVHLAGPRDYAPAEVAAVYATLFRRSVEVVAPPAAAWPEILVEGGLSRSYADALAVMFAGLNDGSIGWPDDAVPRRGATTLEADLGRRA